MLTGKTLHACNKCQECLFCNRGQERSDTWRSNAGKDLGERGVGGKEEALTVPCRVKVAVLMPTTRAAESSRGPPELPWLMAASVCSSSQQSSSATRGSFKGLPDISYGCVTWSLNAFKHMLARQGTRGRSVCTQGVGLKDPLHDSSWQGILLSPVKAWDTGVLCIALGDGNVALLQQQQPQ